MTPQKLDAVVRTCTASLLALSLVGAVTYIAISQGSSPHGGLHLTDLQAGLLGWAGVVIGFYFGGHVANNTSALEETRQRVATAAAEDSAARSEASAVRSESGNSDVLPR